MSLYLTSYESDSLILYNVTFVSLILFIMHSYYPFCLAFPAAQALPARFSIPCPTKKPGETGLGL